MPASYTAAQVAAAREDWLFWIAKPGAKPIHAGALLGNNDGEDSFDDRARGDRGTAGGKSQWHRARRDLILRHTGIDVWAATPAKQLEAMWAEMTAPWSGYRHVWVALTATTTLEAAVAVLVETYEQSGSQARDIARRTHLAGLWLAAAGDWSKPAKGAKPADAAKPEGAVA